MSDGQLVKDIAKKCFTDAVEALSIIEVLEAANGSGVSRTLNHVERQLLRRRQEPLCASAIRT